MPTSARSYGKINLGLRLGPARPDGFHELRTCYHSIALHDVVRVERQRGSGIEIRALAAKGAQVGDVAAAEFAAKVPCDASNTCYRAAEELLRRAHHSAKLLITIEKGLPVQGGLGAASSNALATLLAAEREMEIALEPQDRYAICAAIGSDVPQFLWGGLTLGVGRGEQVYPLPDLPAIPTLLVTPRIGVSTAKAFSAWDALNDESTGKLTAGQQSSNLEVFSQSVYGWLGRSHTGVSTEQGGSRAEAPLLDLVRTGAVNDFERVVFPQHSELSEIKRALERAGALYASLSGSGSTLYGLFASTESCEQAAAQLTGDGHRAYATKTLPRREYWDSFWTK